MYVQVSCCCWLLLLLLLLLLQQQQEHGCTDTPATPSVTATRSIPVHVHDVDLSATVIMSEPSASSLSSSPSSSSSSSAVSRPSVSYSASIFIAVEGQGEPPRPLNAAEASRGEGQPPSPPPHQLPHPPVPLDDAIDHFDLPPERASSRYCIQPVNLFRLVRVVIYLLVCIAYTGDALDYTSPSGYTVTVGSTHFRNVSASGEVITDQSRGDNGGSIDNGFSTPSGYVTISRYQLALVIVLPCLLLLDGCLLLGDEWDNTWQQPYLVFSAVAQLALVIPLPFLFLQAYRAYSADAVESHILAAGQLIFAVTALQGLHTLLLLPVMFREQCGPVR